MSVDYCKIIELPKLSGSEGSLTFIESGKHIPFDIRRVYYLYDIPEGGERGAHAHLTLSQVLIAVSGSFDVHIDDGINKKKVRLDAPWTGLLIPRMIWRDLSNFSSGAVCLVLASLPYDESEYIRSYQAFIDRGNAERDC